MTFHTAPQFVAAIEAAAIHFNLRETFIEKDYWITWVLRNLALSEFTDTVVFKGGTSLSKAHNCIHRYSEDIDLAVVYDASLNGNQLKSRIQAVEKSVISGLEYFYHESEKKSGRYRRTSYHYPRLIESNDFGAVKNYILIEINSFTNPVPHNKKNIQSMLGQFLAREFRDLVEQHGLHPFPVNVLTRERTFFEKLMSLIRMSYRSRDDVRDKVRHFYDLHLILHHEDLVEKVLIDAHFDLVDLVLADDARHKDFGGDWITQPLASSPLFANHAAYWADLSPRYVAELDKLAWAKIPSTASIHESLDRMRNFLDRYDQRRN